MIRFDSVTKEYPDGSVAVHDISFTAESHQTTVLVGSSGSGKTTLMRMVNRMVNPTQGTVSIDEADVADQNPVTLRRSIGYVMQQAGLLPHKNVLANIGTVLRLQGAHKSEVTQRVHELMELVGLDPSLGNRYPHQLSGGQQQRVGVARGLATNPNILLMDEPFSAVDPLVRADLQAELLRLQGELGKTILFVTHDIDEALCLSDKLVILNPQGTIAQTGTSADILANPASEFVSQFLGAKGTQRTFTTRTTDAGTLIVDSHGRALGTLAADAKPYRRNDSSL